MADDEHEYEDTQEQRNEYEDTNEPKSAEDVANQIAAKDFDPDRLLYDIQKALNGYDKRNGEWVRVTYPLARTEFITLYINSIRALVNFHSLFSMTPSEEAAFNMLESLKEITYAAVDYGVKEEHIETFINMYDTMKGTFYGITIDGRGTENIKQVLTSVYQDLTKQITQPNKGGLVNWAEVNRVLKN